MSKQKNTKKINIYISNETKQYLREIQEKYCLSFSAITNLIFNEYIKQTKKTNNLCDLLFDKEATNKTSIKPKNIDFIENFANHLNLSKGNATKLLSNLIYLTATNKVKTFVRKYEDYKTSLYNEFQKSKDKYYKYNFYCRNQPRFIKQNREYVKKLLGE